MNRQTVKDNLLLRCEVTFKKISRAVFFSIFVLFFFSRLSFFLSLLRRHLRPSLVISRRHLRRHTFISVASTPSLIHNIFLHANFIIFPRRHRLRGAPAATISTPLRRWCHLSSTMVSLPPSFVSLHSQCHLLSPAVSLLPSVFLPLSSFFNVATATPSPITICGPFLAIIYFT